MIITRVIHGPLRSFGKLPIPHQRNENDCARDWVVDGVFGLGEGNQILITLVHSRAHPRPAKIIRRCVARVREIKT